jgi:hypothetical protein
MDVPDGRDLSKERWLFEQPVVIQDMQRRAKTIGPPKDFGEPRTAMVQGELSRAASQPLGPTIGPASRLGINRAILCSKLFEAIELFTKSRRVTPFIINLFS